MNSEHEAVLLQQFPQEAESLVNDLYVLALKKWGFFDLSSIWGLKSQIHNSFLVSSHCIGPIWMVEIGSSQHHHQDKLSWSTSKSGSDLPHISDLFAPDLWSTMLDLYNFHSYGSHIMLGNQETVVFLTFKWPKI